MYNKKDIRKRERKMKKLYLSTSVFNEYLLINELQKIVIKKGGYILSSYLDKSERYYITNRTIKNNILENETKINRLKNREVLNAKQKEYLNTLENENKSLNKYNKNRIVNNQNFISFILGNDCYYVQLDENPFFDFYYMKTRCEKIDNKVITSERVYLDTLNKSFIYSENVDLWANLTNTQIKKIATNLFNQVYYSTYSEVHDKNKKSTYNIIRK